MPGPDGYDSVVSDKKGLYSADITYDAEFERWMHIGEDAAHGKGPGGRYYRELKPGDAFKGYKDTRTGEMARYMGKYPTWQIKRAKEELRNPWYLTVRDCGLKVGLRAAVARCRKAGIGFGESESVPGIMNYCVKQQREAVHHMRDQLASNLTYQSMLNEKGIDQPVYGHIVKEVRDEAVVGAYDGLGVPSPKEIQRTVRMNILRPFGALVAGHGLGDVSKLSTEARKDVAEKVASVIVAAVGEYDGCITEKRGKGRHWTK